MAQITLDNIAFRYPGAQQDALTGLSLDIADGEAHALLGASGSGKTTLLNLLSGLISPSAGTLQFDGRDVSRTAARDRDVAQVFQFPVLYESLSVAQNLAFPLETRAIPAARAAERIDYILSELDISGIRDRRSKSLSLFEKQLVAVGKALVREDVSMVLLDEPLTAVEPRIKWRLRQRRCEFPTCVPQACTILVKLDISGTHWLPKLPIHPVTNYSLRRSTTT